MELFADLALPVPRFSNYTYAVHKDLHEAILPGMRTRIRFGRQMLTGTVIRLHSTPYPGKTETILELMDEEPLFTPELLDLGQALSKYYFTPLGMVFHTMGAGLGKKPKRLRSTKDRPEQQDIGFFDQKLVQSVTQCQEQVCLVSDEIRRPGNYLKLAEYALENSMNVVFIVPHLDQVEFWKKKLSCFSNVCLIHSSVSPARKYRYWNSLRTAESRIALGTRQAVFAPVNGKSMFIIIDEDSRFLSEETGLHYNAVHTALMRSKLAEHKLVLSSPAPSIFSRVKSEKSFALTYPQAVDKTVKSIHITLNNFEIHNPQFLELIHNFKKKEKSSYCLILYPGAGYVRGALCGACGFLFKCPVCDSSLHYTKQSNVFCPKCRKKTNPLPCQSCGKSSIRFFLPGRDKLHEWVDKNTGNNVKVIVHESSGKNIPDDTDIVIAPLNLQAPMKKHPQILVIMNPDYLLLKDDYRNTEIFMNCLRRAWLLLVSGKTEEIHILYRHIDETHPCYDSWKDQKSMELVAGSDSSIRKKLNYPPYGSLIALEMRFKSEKSTDCIPLLGMEIKRIMDKCGAYGIGELPGNRKRGKTPEYIYRIQVPQKNDSQFSELMLAFLSQYKGKARIMLKRL